MKRIYSALCILLLITSAGAQWLGKSTDVPSYHLGPPPKGTQLPATLTPDQVQVPDSKYSAMQKHAYEIAAKVQTASYQQPCYCHCDRGPYKHKSLHSCFEDQHGAECGTCLKEIYYTYLMTKQGKSAEQIREGIVAGEWQSVDLETAGSIN